MLKVHRIAFTQMVGKIPEGMYIDHICGVRACVNPAHLRLCSPMENSRNYRKPKTNTSGFKGVTWSKKRKAWRALIRVSGKQKELGVFATPWEAHEAYRKAAKEFFGEFANFGECDLDHIRA